MSPKIEPGAVWEETVYPYRLMRVTADDGPGAAGGRVSCEVLNQKGGGPRHTAILRPSFFATFTPRSNE